MYRRFDEKKFWNQNIGWLYGGRKRVKMETEFSIELDAYHEKNYNIIEKTEEMETKFSIEVLWHEKRFVFGKTHKKKT